MKAARAPVSIRLMIMLGTLLAGISSCRFMPASQTLGMRTLSLSAASASVLVIIVNQGSLSAMRATGALVAASARPRERVFILGSQGGAILASSQAPPSPTARVTDPPAPLSSQPTSFQKARYRQAVRQYRAVLLRARRALQKEQQQELAAWASSTVAKAAVRPVLQSTRTAGISADLGAAVSDLSSMRQAGLGGAPAVIAIIGVDVTTALPVPKSTASLQSSTVVMDDFAGTATEEAAWQAGFVQGGAARAVILTPATDDQLAPVVEQGLDGAVADTLTSVLFGLGQYQLQATARPQLRRLLHLLTVTYPHATATINGYTDSLPAPGGNILLSRQRAQAVEEWLIAHGAAAGRLQVFGYGDTDPVAPDSSRGQPLNRRVVVVIDPALSA